MEFVKTLDMFLSFIYLNTCFPLVFFQYNIFRGGDIVEYENLMVQVAVLFISRERRYYNKSTLSFLSDMDYERVFLPDYWSKKLQFLSLITEKKVEIFHSLLREHTREHNDAAKCLSDTAKVIASRGFLSAVKEAFPFYHKNQLLLPN